MIVKKNKILPLFCASFLLATPLSAKSDDYPDSLNTLDETSQNPRINLGQGMSSDSLNLHYYYKPMEADDIPSYITRSMPYRYKEGYIEGVLENEDDVDLININIPNNLYVEFTPDSMPNGETLPYVITDNNYDFSPLLNGIVFGRSFSKFEEEDKNEVLNIFDVINYDGKESFNGSYEGIISKYNEARINHKLYIDGQEDYTLVVTSDYVANGRNTNISYPYEYKIKYYLTDQPLSKYHMATIREQSLSSDYKFRYFKVFEDIASDPAINVGMEYYYPLNSNLVSTSVRKDYEIVKSIDIYDKDLYCVGESAYASDNTPNLYRGIVNNELEVDQNVLAECESYVNAFKTRNVLDKNKEFYYGRKAESSYKESARKALSYSSNFEFLENNELSKFFFNTEKRRNYNDNYSKIHVILGDSFTDNNPFARQSKKVDITNVTTGEKETLTLQEAECASPYKYKKNEINEINYYETSYCLIGELEKIKSTLPIDEKGVIGVSTGDVLRYEASSEYNDPIYPELSKDFNAVYEMTMFEVPLQGELSVPQNFIVDRYNENTIDVRLEDQDANRKTNEIETIDVLLKSENRDEETITLTETSENSGIFLGNTNILIAPFSVKNNGLLELRLNNGYKTSFEVIYEDKYAVSKTLEDRGDYSINNEGPFDFGLEYYEQNPVTITLEKELQFKNNATSSWSGGTTQMSVNQSKDFRISDCGVGGQEEISDLLIKNTTKNIEYSFKLELQENGCDLLVDNSTQKLKIVSETTASDLESGTYIIADDGDTLELSYTDFSPVSGENIILNGTVNVSGFIGEEGRLEAYINDFYDPSRSFNKFYYYGDSFKLFVNVRDDDLDITNGVDTGKATLINKTKNIEKEIILEEMTEDYCQNFFNSYICRIYSHFSKEIEIETDSNNDFYIEDGDLLEVVYDDKSYTTPDGIRVAEEYEVVRASDASWLDFDLTLGKDALIRIFDEDSNDWYRMGGDYSEAGFVLIENLSKNYSLKARLSEDYSTENEMFTNGNVFLTSYDASLADKVDGSVIETNGRNSYVELPVEVGDEIRLTFTDKISSDSLGDTITTTKTVKSYDIDTDVIVFTNQIFPEQSFEITVIDKLANQDSDEIDTLEVNYNWYGFRNGDMESIVLTETGLDTSVFKTDVILVTTENPVENNSEIEADIDCRTCSEELEFTYESANATYTYEKETSFTVEPINIEYSGSGAINDSLQINLTDPNIAFDDWVEFSGFVNIEYSNGETYRKDFYEYEQGNEIVLSYDLKEFYPSEMTSQEFQEKCVGSSLIEGPSMNEDIICADVGAKITVVLDKYGQTFDSNFTVENKIPTLSMEVSSPVYIEDAINIKVSDFVSNQNANERDTVTVAVLFNDLSGEGLYDTEIVELTENDVNSGIFEGTLTITERNGSVSEFNNILEGSITKFTDENLVVIYSGEEFTPENVFGDFPVLLFEERDVLGGDLAVITSNETENLNSKASFYVSDKDRIIEGTESFDVIVENTRTNESVTINVVKYSNEQFIGEINLGSEDALFYNNYLTAEKGDYISISYLDPDNKLLEEELVSETLRVAGGYDAQLSVKRTILVNDNVDITVIDQDGNVSQNEIDTLTVQVENQRTLETETVMLTEDDANSGVFSGAVETRYSEDEISEQGVFGAIKDDVFEFTYIDDLNSTNDTEELAVERIISSGFTATISSPSVYEKESNSLIPVNVYDLDMNTKPFEIESFQINVRNTRTNETAIVTVQETRNNSGVFSGFLNVNNDSQENYLSIEADDLLEFTYNDDFNEEGGSSVVTSSTEIVSNQNSVTAILEASEPVYIVDTITIRVIDSDLNSDPAVIEETTVDVLNERTGENEIVTLKEMSQDSSEFSGSLETVYGTDEAGPNESIGEMNVQKDDELTITHIDDMDEAGDSRRLVVSRIVVAGFDATLDVEENLKVGDTIDVGVIDFDINNENEIEQVSVTVLNERTGESETVVLTETSVDSSTFIGSIDTLYSESELSDASIMGVVAQDSLLFTYIDTFNSKGEVNSDVTEIRALSGGIDAELTVNSNEIVGENINIKVVDADENKTPEIDTTTAVVVNTRTNEKETVTLTETSNESGIFVVDLPTVFNEEFQNEDNELSVLAEDLVKVSYEDQFNSDGGKTVLSRDLIFKAGFDGEISVTTPNEIGNAMIVTVRDRDLNRSSGIDTVVVKIHNERTEEFVELLLTEQLNEGSRVETRAGASAPANNAFVGMVYGVNEMVGFGKGSELETFSGDYLVATYLDEFNSQGQSETLTAKGLFLGADAIVLDKNALEDSAVVGSLVPYTVEVENVSPNDLTNVEIIDNLPAGFRLAKDFVYVGDDKEPVSANGGVMTVTLDEIESNETIVLTYVLKVSSGVVEGAYENKVKPYIGNILVGNEARATVYIQDDPLFNDALVFGKVFDDVNGNGYLDNGEEGIPGVTIAGVDGINVVTDSKGRYSIEGIDGGRMDRGVNYILKVMPETLPEGSEFTTENPRVQRITQGMPSKFNFGVAVPKQGAYTAMVEVRLGEVFFDWDKDNVKEEYESSLNRIANFIEEQGGGIIIIEGNTDSLGTDEYNEDLALRRASAVYKVLKDYLSDEVYQNIEVKIIK